MRQPSGARLGPPDPVWSWSAGGLADRFGDGAHCVSTGVSRYCQFTVQEFAQAETVYPSGGASSVRVKAKLALEILRAYVFVRWTLLRFPFREALAVVRENRRGSKGGAWEATIPAAKGLGRAVQRTLGPLPLDSRCLIRSLVLVRVLSRRGVEAPLVIGVAGKPQFAAHAWVELGGVPLLPSGTAYERLTEL